MTFYLCNLVDHNEISVLHWCVCACISLCGCLQWLRLSGKRAPIKQFVSDSEGLQPRGGGTSADLGLLTGLRRLMTLARLSILNLFQVIHLSQEVFEEDYNVVIINKIGTPQYL